MLVRSEVGESVLSLKDTARLTRKNAARRVARIFASVFVLALALLFTPFIAQAQLHQSKLFIDDGTGLFTIIKSLSLTAGQSVNFPYAGGTDAQIVLMKSPFDASNAWRAGDLLYAATNG